MKRRRLFKLVVFLVLGAIINVAVAWAGFVATDGYGYPRMVILDRWVQTNANARDLWARHASDGWPQPFDNFRSWHGLFASGWSMSLAVGDSFSFRRDATDAELRELYKGSGTFEVEQIDCGFPLGSMRLERWHGTPSRWYTPSKGHDGFSLIGYTLPSCPLFVRFAINTIFYAALFWSLVFAPFQFRRWRRMRRGLCPACAYPIGASDKCSECGARLPLPPPEGEGRGEGKVTMMDEQIPTSTLHGAAAPCNPRRPT